MYSYLCWLQLIQASKAYTLITRKVYLSTAQSHLEAYGRNYALLSSRE